MNQDTLLAVFTTDSWHTHGSRVLIGVATHMRAAIRCINQEQKKRCHKRLSKEQELLLHRIRQTQSGAEIEGEYAIDEVKLWGHDVQKKSPARRIVMGESTQNPDKFKRGEKVEP